MRVALLVLVATAAAAGQKEAPRRPLLLGIDHVAFRVSAAEPARDFYAGVLGLVVRQGRTSADPAAVHLGSRQRILLEPGLAAGEDERLSHLAFATSDLDAMHAYLGSQGLAAPRPALQPCGARGLRVRDPDGHVIEFVEAQPSVRVPVPRQALSSRLLHAGITVRDEAAAHGFYRDVLGMSEIWRGGREKGPTSWINMRVPDGTDYVEYMLVEGPVDRQQLGVLHHACLLVPDIQEAWDAVRARTAAGARAAPRPPQIGRNNRWQLNLYDPDGTRVELMEPWTVR